jgi:hypothetical protein
MNSGCFLRFAEGKSVASDDGKQIFERHKKTIWTEHFNLVLQYRTATLISMVFTKRSRLPPVQIHFRPLLAPPIPLAGAGRRLIG